VLAVVFGALAVAGFLQWRHRPGRPNMWLAASFGVLGVAVVAGQLLPDGSDDALVPWGGKVVLAVLALFPYCLYRFMSCFLRPIPWIRVSAIVLTAAVSVGALLLPELPDLPANGEPRPAWSGIYVAALLTQWLFLSGVVSVRLWRAGSGHPGVARRRMRTMSVGAAGLALAILMAGAPQSDAGGAEVAMQALAIGAAPLMLVAFAPPRFLRAAWRGREETALKDAGLALMRATTVPEVAEALLPHARTLVGARGALLELPTGVIVASDGLDDEQARAAMRSGEDDGPAASDGTLNGSLVRLPLGRGRLAVLAGPFAPFFGRDEIASLEGLIALADLALARNELLESQQRLAAIVESSEDAIISKTPDGIITSWNRGAERLYGWSSEEVVGRPTTTLVSPGLEGEVPAAEETTRASERVERYETQRLTKHGRTIDLALTISPIRDANGTVTGSSEIARDVSERRDVERQREAARIEADLANQAKSEFLSRVSHELRTPLNAILGFAQLLELDELDGRHGEAVGHIVKGGRHLLELINEVLDIARIEAGELRLSLEPVAADELAEESIALVGALADRRGIRIEADFRDVDSAWVLADRQRLKQVLLNLLSNAIKYNRETGHVRVSLEARGDDRLAVLVSDSGPGIAPEQQKDLFEPFERLGAERGDVEGTGLGLTLSKRLVEAMGGTLEADSHPGRGTTMSVELERSGPSDSEGRKVERAPRSALGGRRVLYIEDNLANLKLVERVLEEFPDVRLLPAMQGNIGLELAREHRPELVLLDLHLPDIPGREVLLRLKAEPSLRDTPVVVVTADATDREERRMLADGAHAYLTKPFEIDRFLAVVEKCLRGDAVPQ
jgi:PAS domain S-box-containing protein